MHYLIFIPDTNDCSPAVLENVGLGKFIADANFTPCDNGPENKTGVMVSWGFRSKPIYEPGSQKWRPAVAKGGLEFGRYQVGFWNDSPPEPSELLRPNAIHGVAVEMGDCNHWTLPPLSQLPAKFVLNDDGSRHVVICQEYNAYYIEAMRQVGKAADNDGRADLYELADIIEMALSFNYRMIPEVIDSLDLLSLPAVERAFMKITNLTEAE